MDKFFKISERGSTVRTEIVAGITTFFTMAYIIFVNSGMLAETGMDQNAVLVATCIASAIGCFLTAFLANVPFAQAPGMGLNAFFTYSICFGMGYTWQQALTLVLISGVVFLLITISPLRKVIIDSIPAVLKSAIGCGIGVFLALLGFVNSGLIQFSAGIPDLNPSFVGGPTLTLIGLLITIVLLVLKVKGAIFIGIVATTLVGIPMGVTMIPEQISLSSISLAPTLFQLDFNVLALGVLPFITAVVTFTMVDMFDTMGTLIGVTEGTEIKGKDYDKALIADAVATCAGALIGTSTVTTYVESASGVEEGGRTGLTSLVVGVLFVLAIFLAPIAGIISGAATAPALIIVGVFMMKNASKVAWDNMEDAIPAFLTIIGMPFFYSIADGISAGFISYIIIKVAKGKFKEIPITLWILSIIFVALYALSHY